MTLLPKDAFRAEFTGVPPAVAHVRLAFKGNTVQRVSRPIGMHAAGESTRCC